MSALVIYYFPFAPHYSQTEEEAMLIRFSHFDIFYGFSLLLAPLTILISANESDLRKFLE